MTPRMTQYSEPPSSSAAARFGACRVTWPTVAAAAPPPRLNLAQVGDAVDADGELEQMQRHEPEPRRQRLRRLRRRRTFEHGADEAPGFGHGGEIDAGAHAEAVEHVEHVLGGDVARGARGEGTAAEAGDRGVDDGDAALQAGEDVGQRLTVGVVKVHRQRLDRHLRGDRVDHGDGAAGRAGADGVAQRDLPAAELEERAGDGGDRRRRNLALVGTIERAGDVAADRPRRAPWPRRRPRRSAPGSRRWSS